MALMRQYVRVEFVRHSLHSFLRQITIAVLLLLLSVFSRQLCHCREARVLRIFCVAHVLVCMDTYTWCLMFTMCTCVLWCVVCSGSSDTRHNNDKREKSISISLGAVLTWGIVLIVRWMHSEHEHCLCIHGNYTLAANKWIFFFHSEALCRLTSFVYVSFSVCLWAVRSSFM